MSSALISIASFPDLISSSMPFKPSTILSLSLLSIMPVAPSIVACAMLPLISSSNILESNLIEELKSLVSFASSFLNLPFQSCAIKFTSFVKLRANIVRPSDFDKAAKARRINSI